jgi:HK97 gp10 family phage protein
MTETVKITTDVVGLKELLAALEDLGSEVAGNKVNLVRTALMAAALPVLKTAKALVPVDTGRLQKAIKRQRHKNPKYLNEVVGVGVDPGRKRDDLTGAWYGYIVEFRESFLRPALETNRANSIGIFRKRLAAGVEREAKKIGNKNAAAVGAKIKKL